VDNKKAAQDWAAFILLSSISYLALEAGRFRLRKRKRHDPHMLVSSPLWLSILTRPSRSQIEQQSWCRLGLPAPALLRPIPGQRALVIVYQCATNAATRRGVSAPKPGLTINHEDIFMPEAMNDPTPEPINGH
jgi:hypothetical protein